MKKVRFYIIIAIILALCFIIYYKFFRTAKEFILDDEGKYIVTTDAATRTVMSDGGTHYNERYYVDLNKKKVTHVLDYYKGFEGCKYKDRIISEKKLNNDEVKQLRELFENIKDNPKKVERFFSYKLEHINDEAIEIYSDETIEKIENLLSK